MSNTDHTFTVLEQEAAYNRTMPVGIDADYDYPVSEFGNLENKLESLQRQIDILTKLVRELC